MFRKLFLLAVFVGMVMGLGCGTTYNLTKMAANDPIPASLGSADGRPVVAVMKKDS